MEWFQSLREKEVFNYSEILAANEKSGKSISEISLRRKIQNMLKQGTLVHVGRNMYSFPDSATTVYRYEYSPIAVEIAETILSNYQSLLFSVEEMIQINEFVNHQIAHNVILVFVENEIKEFVFETLKDKYPGKVLLKPDIKEFDRYRCDDLIVIDKLVTEAPKGRGKIWHTRLEKLIVDLIAEPLWTVSIEESEYAKIIEDAFTRYVIDEGCLFRYARRRTAEKKIKDIINNQTNVILKTARNGEE